MGPIETHHQSTIIRPVLADVHDTLHAVEALDERALVHVRPWGEVFLWAVWEGEGQVEAVYARQHRFHIVI